MLNGAHLQSLIDEKKALDEKLDCLSDFINTPEYIKLAQVDRFDIRRQRMAMAEYTTYLACRIDRST